MKVLWVCNLVLPEFAPLFGIKKSSFGGWMSATYKLLVDNPDVDLCFAFPIYDKEKRSNKAAEKIHVFSFDGMMDRNPIDSCYIAEFEYIFQQEMPDVVHVWGTEYNHSYYALCAAENNGIGRKVLVDIQGIVSFISMHYLDGIPKMVIDDPMYIGKAKGLKTEQEYYSKQSEIEKMTLQKSKVVTGRTSWDYSCTRIINPGLNYYYNSRLLREGFYKHSGEWRREKCKKHRVFISNASYALKGFHCFIYAIEMLRQQYDDLNVIIAGPNPFISNNSVLSQYAVYLSDLIRKMHLEGVLFFVGVLDEKGIIDELLKANVFVVSSTVENSCNSLCEAMMIGTPVVSSYSGGLPDLIAHGNNGFLYQNNAPYMAAHYIRVIFDDSARAEMISKNAVGTAMERHDRGDIINKMLTMYERVSDL